MVEFSRRGDRVLSHERALIAEVDDISLRDTQVPFLELARRVGVDALACVLDELGGSVLYIPTREFFFSALYRQRRDAEILRRLANGESKSDLAAAYGMHKRSIQKVVERNDMQATPPPTVVGQRRHG